MHFLKFRFAPDQVGTFDRRSGTHRRRPSRVSAGRRAHARTASGARRGPRRHRIDSAAVQIRIRRLDPDVKLPERQHAGRCGLRLVRARADRGSQPVAGARSCRPASRSRFRSGYAGFVQPRSGLALRHGVTCLNTPGLIDAGYRDEISVLLINHDPDQAFDIKPGDRIAQLVIQRVVRHRVGRGRDARRHRAASAVGGRRAGGSGR